MKNTRKKIIYALCGISIGAVNSLLGAGGGMLAVPLLKRNGLEQKEAQCNAIAVILPITILSAFMYVHKGYAKVNNALPYIPGGIIGAFAGTYFMKKISSVWLKRIFGGFMVYAGIRLLLR
ncbi:MAG: sulfite exporter TauE/SafE family protein [Clostridia bacterium]|nr:sulfite exporter TauE/SafE family protein [Clostridia bacterium]